MSIELLSIEAYRRSVAVRDLTDPGQGAHALQLVVDEATSALTRAWSAQLVVRRANPIVPIEDNYDRLHYPPDGAARDARYTRYVSERLVFRTQTSAMIPPALDDLARDASRADDVLLACPGLVYRRDAIDRLHTGEPHQLDLWRVRRGNALGRDDLLAMIDTVIGAVLPGTRRQDRPEYCAAHQRSRRFENRSLR